MICSIVTTAPPQTVSVPPNKVPTPVTVTSQRFAMQIPPSQSAPAKPGNVIWKRVRIQE